jgi:pyruvate dehydrogenase E1 component
VHGIPMLPFYIFYSMFGFQRVGDLIWAAADQRSRGFLLGATAGRTTLSGEGLQHQDGSSPLVASTVPNCRSYDPAFGYEVAVIFDHGMRAMLEKQEDVFYYVTLYNANYAQPSMPAGEAVGDSIIKGLYRCSESAPASARGRVRLLGSGAIMPEVLSAAEILAEEWQIASEVWSATSYSELEREARAVERWNSRHPESKPRRSHVSESLSGTVPVVAATDYVRAYPQLIAPYIEARLRVVGTDGFGRSDTRPALRRFFEVDAQHIVLAALDALVREGIIKKGVLTEALRRYAVNPDAPAPWTV